VGSAGEMLLHTAVENWNKSIPTIASYFSFYYPFFFLFSFFLPSIMPEANEENGSYCYGSVQTREADQNASAQL